MIRELIWHKDGHFLTLRINKAEVEVNILACPHGESKDAECYHAAIDGCIVKHFVKVYGLEVNLGQIDASSQLEVAWSCEGSDWDIDLVHFYMIPAEDPQFKDWYDSKTGDE